MVQFSRSRARRQHSPGAACSAKSHFSSCPVSGPFSAYFWRLSRRVLESLLEGSGSLFSVSGAGHCAACEKAVFWSASWSEEHRPSIAKTCKPYSTSFKNRRCALTAICSPTCGPRRPTLGPQKRFFERPIRGRYGCFLALGLDASF